MNAKRKIVFAIFVISTGVVLSLFNSWEMSGETWGYWMYARIFSECGTFSVKSPLYSLYLSGFLWLGHPDALTIEYIVTTAVVASGLVTLLRPYMGLCLSVFALILWLPFLQVAEPLNQKLAIGLICWALVLRRSAKGRMQTSCSYALMMATYSLRAPFFIFLILFAAMDFLLLKKQEGWKSALKTLHPRVSDWPVGASLLLIVWFTMAQSALPWNNIYFGTTTYFPNSGKSQLSGTMMQSYNWDYIEMKYGSFVDKDFYFTNQEAFKGAKNVFEQFSANPALFLKITCRKVRKTFNSLVSLMDIGFLWSSGLTYPWSGLSYPMKLLRIVLAVFEVLMLLLIVYGAFRMAQELREKESVNMTLFLIGNLIIVASASIGAPSIRYLTPFIPVLICSACWYGKLTCNASVKTILWLNTFSFFGRQIWPPQARPHTICIALLLILLSNGISQWSNVKKAFADQMYRGEFRIMEGSPYSMKTPLNSLQALTQNCRGVLSLEHNYIGAFTNIPLYRIYDVWEIPPFGHLGESVYAGLRPERIDCVLESHALPTMVGCATNVQIRYQNYIKPYIEHLQGLGARVYEVPQYGRAIILTNQPAAQTSTNMQTNTIK